MTRVQNASISAGSISSDRGRRRRRRRRRRNCPLNQGKPVLPHAKCAIFITCGEWIGRGFLC